MLGIISACPERTGNKTLSTRLTTKFLKISIQLRKQFYKEMLCVKLDLISGGMRGFRLAE